MSSPICVPVTRGVGERSRRLVTVIADDDERCSILDTTRPENSRKGRQPVFSNMHELPPAFSPCKNLVIFETRLLSVSFFAIRKRHHIYFNPVFFFFSLLSTVLHYWETSQPIFSYSWLPINTPWDSTPKLFLFLSWVNLYNSFITRLTVSFLFINHLLYLFCCVLYILSLMSLTFIEWFWHSNFRCCGNSFPYH